MKHVFTLGLTAALLIMAGCNSNNKSQIKQEVKMELTNKDKAVAVIESLQTGAKEIIGYINPTKSFRNYAC